MLLPFFRRRYQAAAAAAALGIHALASIACGSSSTTTSPTSPTATPVSVVEHWSGTLPVGGSVFYAFSVGQTGTVNISLENVGGTFVPETVMVGLAVGTPSASICAAATPTIVQAGSTPAVTSTQNPGTYCAVLSDIGNLYSDARFTIAIEHP